MQLRKYVFDVRMLRTLALVSSTTSQQVCIVCYILTSTGLDKIDSTNPTRIKPINNVINPMTNVIFAALAARITAYSGLVGETNDMVRDKILPNNIQQTASGPILICLGRKKRRRRKRKKGNYEQI